MLPEWLPWLLQVNDSQFPSGAYAHSFSLEEFAQRDLVSKPDDVRSFLEDFVVPALLAFDLPMLGAAHDLAAVENAAGLRGLDEELDAWKVAAELRQGSRQIGSRRLALVRKLDRNPFPAAYADSGAPCHALIVCAIELRALPREAVGCAFCHQAVSGYAIAAMKLIRMGQERCHEIIRKAVSQLAPKIPGAMDTPRNQAGWFNPLVDIASMRHARSRERLFIS